MYKQNQVMKAQGCYLENINLSDAGAAAAGVCKCVYGEEDVEVEDAKCMYTFENVEAEDNTCICT